VHVAGQERINARRFVSDADILNFVEIRPAGLEVFVVAGRDRSNPRLELFAFEWTGAVCSRKIGRLVLDDQEMRNAEDDGKISIGPGQRI
jgi:hypothetical protein